jgi:hypothetical protein
MTLGSFSIFPGERQRARRRRFEESALSLKASRLEIIQRIAL